MLEGSPYNSIEPVHPAVIEAREVIRLEQQQRGIYLLDEDIRKLARAVMLSPTLDVCEALLRGEHVPTSRLDPAWVRRYGMRESA